MTGRLVLACAFLAFAAPAGAQGLLDPAAERAFWCEAANEEMMLNGKLSFLDAVHGEMAKLPLAQRRGAEAARLGLSEVQIKAMQVSSRLVAQMEVADYAIDGDPAALSYDYRACIRETL